MAGGRFILPAGRRIIAVKDVRGFRSVRPDNQERSGNDLAISFS